MTRQTELAKRLIGDLDNTHTLAAEICSLKALRTQLVHWHSTRMLDVYKNLVLEGRFLRLNAPRFGLCHHSLVVLQHLI